MASRFMLLAVPIVAVSLLTSCGGSPTVGIADEGAAPIASPLPPDKATVRNIPINAFDDPSSTERITYSAGLLSDPMPTPLPDVKVTQDRALEVAAGDSFGSDLQPGSPVVALRQVTLGEGSEASVTPGWVLVWKGSAPKINGKPGMSQEQIDAEKASVRCLFVYVVNANSGKGVDAREICQPKE